MKSINVGKSFKRNGYQSDDDNVRYKLNTQYFAKKPQKSPPKDEKKVKAIDDNYTRYKLPEARVNIRPLEQKTKSKPKIKVNFWSNKQSVPRLNKDRQKSSTKRRHTVAVTGENAIKPSNPKSVVKVRKRVSFLPSPLFFDNHIPMVTVPDDLTIHLNEEEANELREDLKAAYISNKNQDTDVPDSPSKSKTSTTQTSPKGSKRKHSFDEPRIQNNDSELEFFSKYVVQKLRRMETNQRIYSENLINTVLMLGQLKKLNGKSKIVDNV